MRRSVLTAVSVILVLAGAVFALQGLRFLPSRLMYGEPAWVVIGGLMVVAGLVALARLRRSV